MADADDVSMKTKGRHRPAAHSQQRVHDGKPARVARHDRQAVIGRKREFPGLSGPTVNK